MLFLTATIRKIVQRLGLFMRSVSFYIKKKTFDADFVKNSTRQNLEFYIKYPMNYYYLKYVPITNMPFLYHVYYI